MNETGRRDAIWRMIDTDNGEYNVWDRSEWRILIGNDEPLENVHTGGSGETAVQIVHSTSKMDKGKLPSRIVVEKWPARRKPRRRGKPDVPRIPRESVVTRGDPRPLLSHKSWSEWCIVKVSGTPGTRLTNMTQVPTDPGIYEFAVAKFHPLQRDDHDEEEEEKDPSRRAVNEHREEAGAGAGVEPDGGGGGGGGGGDSDHDNRRGKGEDEGGGDVEGEGEGEDEQGRYKVIPLIVVYIGKTDATEKGLRGRLSSYGGASSHKREAFDAFLAAGWDIYVRWRVVYDMETRTMSGVSRAKALESEILMHYDYALNILENGKNEPRVPSGAEDVDIKGATRLRRSKRLAAKADEERRRQAMQDVEQGRLFDGESVIPKLPPATVSGPGAGRTRWKSPTVRHPIMTLSESSPKSAPLRRSISRDRINDSHKDGDPQ